MSGPKSQLTIDITALRESPTRTSVETRGFELTVDEPEEMGGTDDGPNPLEYLLVAQAGCLNVTGHQVATEMDLDIDRLAIDIEGDFNQAAFTGDVDDPTRLQDIHVTLDVDADAGEETIETWANRVEERCPVSNNVKNETSVQLSVDPQ